MIQEIQILAIIISIIFNIAVILALRSWSVNIKYSLPWVAAGFFMLLFSIFPEIIEQITHTFRITKPINTLFFFAILFLMSVLIMVSVTIAKLKNRLQKLAQIVAIQQHQIDLLRVKTDPAIFSECLSRDQSDEQKSISDNTCI